MPFAVPPVLAFALGAVGAVAVARWLVKESHRINAMLHPRDADDRAGGPEQAMPKLKRDPETGVYRPG